MPDGKVFRPQDEVVDSGILSSSLKTGYQESLGVSSAFIRRVLLIAVSFLMAASIGTQLWFRLVYDHSDHAGRFVMFIVDLFLVDEEKNLPTWFESGMLLMCGVLLFMIGSAYISTHLRAAGYWIILSLMFFYLSVDELVGLHEQSMKMVRSALGVSGYFYFAWVIPALALVFVVGIFFIPFLISLPTDTRTRFIIAGLFYVGGAAGMEMIGAHILLTHGRQSVQYITSVHLEELGEMIGQSLFFLALVDYIRLHFGHIAIDPR